MPFGNRVMKAAMAGNPYLPTSCNLPTALLMVAAQGTGGVKRMFPSCRIMLSCKQLPMLTNVRPGAEPGPV
jgi:hypothetical protein